jgi:3-methyladenine DNA glycosylase Tag
MQTPKKPKKPIDYIMRCMHDAMELVFDYDHDPNFVPSRDELVLFEALHKQITGFAGMSYIIVETMRHRFAEAHAPDMERWPDQVRP